MTSNLLKHNAPVLGAILAGGRARRMGGQEKYLIEIHGIRIIDRLKDILEPQVSKLILNSNDLTMKEITDLETIADLKLSEKAIGPMGGLYTVLDYAREHGFQRVLTTPGDTPFIPENLLNELTGQKDEPITIAQSNGRLHPLCGLWDVSVLPALNSAIDSGNYKMMDFLASQTTSLVNWNA